MGGPTGNLIRSNRLGLIRSTSHLPEIARMKTSKERRPRLLILAVLGAVTLIMLAWMANTIWHRDARRFQGVWSG